MRNRKIALLLLISSSLILPGCGLFQSVEKQNINLAQVEKFSSQAASSHIDTGSTFTKRTYFGTTPEIQAAYLKSFEISMNAANSAASAAILKGSSEDMSKAMNAMSNSSGQLIDLLKSGALGYDETSKSKNGINTTSSADQKEEKETKQDVSSKERKTDYGALLIAGGVPLLIIFLLLVFVVRLSKKVNGLVSIFNGKLTL